MCSGNASRGGKGTELSLCPVFPASALLRRFFRGLMEHWNLLSLHFVHGTPVLRTSQRTFRELQVEQALAARAESEGRRSWASGKFDDIALMLKVFPDVVFAHSHECLECN